jgi:hypothetical protein
MEHAELLGLVSQSLLFSLFYLVGGKMTKRAVKGTAKFTSGALEGTVNAAANLGEGIRKRRNSKVKLDFDQEDFSQFDDDGYNDYYE